jgi:hypothetical protein
MLPGGCICTIMGLILFGMDVCILDLRTT